MRLVRRHPLLDTFRKRTYTVPRSGSVARVHDAPGAPPSGTDAVVCRVGRLLRESGFMYSVRNGRVRDHLSAWSAFGPPAIARDVPRASDPTSETVCHATPRRPRHSPSAGRRLPPRLDARDVSARPNDGRERHSPVDVHEEVR